MINVEQFRQMFYTKPNSQTQHEMGPNSIEVCFVWKRGWHMLANYHQQNVWGHWFLSSGSGPNANFVSFMLSVSFENSTVSFYYSLTSVHSDKQFSVKKYCFSLLVFNIKIGIVDNEVSLTRKPLQCNAKSTSLWLLKQWLSFMSA